MRPPAACRLALALLLLATAGASAGDDPLLGEARGVASSVPPRLLAVLQEEIARGGLEGAIGACREKAPQLAQEASRKTGWQVRRVSLRNRNPRAVPDAWERAVLEDFDHRAAAGEDPAALEKGEIQPREKLNPATPIRKLDQDIILDVNGGMPAVRFPHRQHTEWLDCSNCHEGLFRSRTGETRVSMFLILQGEQCGVCHGAVAFPLTECVRCHSISRQPGQAPEVPGGVNPLMHQPAGKAP